MRQDKCILCAYQIYCRHREIVISENFVFVHYLRKRFCAFASEMPFESRINRNLLIKVYLNKQNYKTCPSEQPANEQTKNNSTTNAKLMNMTNECLLVFVRT